MQTATAWRFPSFAERSRRHHAHFLTADTPANPGARVSLLGLRAVLGRAERGGERVGPRHARHARPQASCAWLCVAPVPLRAFHAARPMPGLGKPHPRGKDAGAGPADLSEHVRETGS
jgi:hypothetical protein